ncbi:MAG: hypothetical protein ACOVLD_06250 [Bacteroidia bacterium]|jgi:hypothetical protein
MNVKCVSCGASQIWDEKGRCSYCGSGIDVDASTLNYQKFLQGDTGNLMIMAETAVEATNWDEALGYYNKVLEKEISNSDAWLGKGIATVYTSKIGNIKTIEAIAYWKNALKHAINSESMAKRIAKEINSVLCLFYPIIEQHFIEFKDLKNSYQELVGKFVLLEKAQDYATQLDPSNISYYETGYALCLRIIQTPQKYAIMDYGAALVKGVIGTLQDNKYKRDDAIEQSRRAQERKDEIYNASLIVYDIEEKYIDNILKRDPNRKIISSKVQFKQSKQGQAQEIKDAFKESNSKGWQVWWLKQSAGMKIFWICFIVIFLIAIVMGM